MRDEPRSERHQRTSETHGRDSTEVIVCIAALVSIKHWGRVRSAQLKLFRESERDSRARSATARLGMTFAASAFLPSFHSCLAA